MKLQAHHLSMLLDFQRWAPPANQRNMEAVNPCTLSDLLDCDLVARDETRHVVLTSRGELALEAALDGMRAAMLDGMRAAGEQTTT